MFVNLIEMETYRVFAGIKIVGCDSKVLKIITNYIINSIKLFLSVTFDTGTVPYRLKLLKLFYVQTSVQRMACRAVSEEQQRLPLNTGLIKHSCSHKLNS